MPDPIETVELHCNQVVVYFEPGLLAEGPAEAAMREVIHDVVRERVRAYAERIERAIIYGEPL